MVSYMLLFLELKSKKGLKILILDEDGNVATSTTNVVYDKIFDFCLNIT